MAQVKLVRADVKTAVVEIDGIPIPVFVLAGADSGGQPQTLPIDGISNALVTMDVVHHEVHEGDMFEC